MSKASILKFPLPPFESVRANNLAKMGILDTKPELIFDILVGLATSIAQMPIGAFTLIDREKQWFKSKIGLNLCETARDISFCTHTILNPDLPLIIADATQVETFSNNPLVTGGPMIRAYVGFPILSPDYKLAIGSLCVLDTVPRQLSEFQLGLLKEVASSINRALEEIYISK